MKAPRLRWQVTLKSLDEGHCFPLILRQPLTPKVEDLPKAHLGLSCKSPWHGSLSLSQPNLCLAPCPGERGGGRDGVRVSGGQTLALPQTSPPDRTELTGVLK